MYLVNVIAEARRVTIIIIYVVPLTKSGLCRSTVKFKNNIMSPITNFLWGAVLLFSTNQSNFPAYNYYKILKEINIYHFTIVSLFIF